MFVGCCNSQLGVLNASLLTRDSACASAAPGSFLWNSFSCGASAPAAAPAPASSQWGVPGTPPQMPVTIIQVDDATSLRAQQEYDARVAAEAAAAASAREVAAAQAALKELQDAGASSASSDDAVLAPGAFGSPTFAPSEGGAIEEGFFDTSSAGTAGNSGLLLALAAAGVAALVMSRRKHGRR